MKTALLAILAMAAVTPAEQAMYSGRFNDAYAAVDKGLQAKPDSKHRFELLLQRVRTQQIARLSGVATSDEPATVKALLAEAKHLPAEMQAKARHAELVSTYFRRLTGAEKGDFMSLQPSFAAVAKELKDPCSKADALFFSGLMYQVSDQVPASAPDLEQAYAAAKSASCDLELSYVVRHLGELAEAKGDMAEAATYAEESLAIRKRIKFDVFVPYSLLQTASVAEKRGDAAKAAADRAEALGMAQRLHLPAQEQAARNAIAEAKKPAK
ncbi:hypothetical protein [Massilia endophytica]|uniref:hypothetical protein n=1 Tax=Massilia endophytica TaxID=2899220 RepID=UPI001E5B152D|nr:hypothetical protein [Massilia endophytica]UGQ47713.1 hypothetical protein LSQ66_04335 [Massilia endophytica]